MKKFLFHSEKGLFFVWIVCSFFSYGMFFANFEGSAQQLSVNMYGVNMRMALFLGLLGGPISLVMAFFLTGFMHYGFKLW